MKSIGRQPLAKNVAQQLKIKQEHIDKGAVIKWKLSKEQKKSISRKLLKSQGYLY